MDSNLLTKEYFDKILLTMRHIDGVKPDTSVILFGEKFATPLMTSAFSHLNNPKMKGMVELAKAAKAAGAVYWCGMTEDEELEEIVATGARVVKIIKPHADPATVYAKLDHAVKAGVMAVGMDIDHAFNGKGEYDICCGLPMRPKSAEELKRYVEHTNLPFIVKGVLSVDDAVKCAEIGAAGIVVSHHHGIMESCVPPLMLLPDIVEAVGGKLTIFVDCGIDSGMDAFKALALGADAVCIGRAMLGSMNPDGAEGAAAYLNQATQQLAGIMARTGYGTVDQIDDSCIYRTKRTLT